ncbi:cytochrome C [Erythrobacter sp. NAP1]|uniref:c-type cytochrome n=1 Tax=Erythrobacter sp. NAP1 TaxID=237727 RepID=UPI0000687761|nr:cytochrome c family protein [Erythrobacter sp. NAP1]EAQ28074.1 cytochrome C [Erythrobacter sp. NAP1]
MTNDNSSKSTPEAETGSGDMFNTAAGWVLFAGVVGLGLSILASKYFHADDPQRPETLGYVIELPDVEEGPSGPTFTEALSMVTAADGERVFAKCSACHSIEAGGANGVGPNLHGIMGAPVGNVSGYSYSSAMASFGGNWGWEEMNNWLDNPRGYMDGTKMGFAGLSSIEDRAAVSLYMNENGSGIPVPEFVPPAEEAEEAAEGEAEAEQDVAEETSEETAAAEG